MRVLATRSFRQFPLPCVTVCHHVPNELYKGFVTLRASKHLREARNKKFYLLIVQNIVFVII